MQITLDWIEEDQEIQKPGSRGMKVFSGIWSGQLVSTLGSGLNAIGAYINPRVRRVEDELEGAVPDPQPEFAGPDPDEVGFYEELT